MPTNHNIEAIIVPSPEIRAEVVRGGIITPVTKELNIVPAVESQRFVPQTPVNGFAPVTVAAVTSAIDSNIQPSNIKEGISILGVEGSLVGLDGEKVTITPTTSQQTITPTSPHNAITEATVEAVTSAIDSAIVPSNIKSGATILGVAGSVTELNGTTTTIAPSTSSQTVSPTTPYNAFTEINVSAVTSSIDSNIQPQNIVQGVNILGVQGTYSGIIPTGTLQITQNGVYDVSNYENADVQTSVPTYYIEKQLDATGTLVAAGGLINLTGVKNIGLYGLAYAYYNSTYAFGALDLSGIEKVTNNYAMLSTFYNCTGITSLDMSGVTEIYGQNALQYAFTYCRNMVTADLSNLETINGGTALSHIFENCTNLITVDMSKLKTVGNFMWAATEMFRYDINLTTVKWDSLEEILGNACLAACFTGCTAMTDIYLPSLKTATASSLSRLCEGTTGMTVHFPSNFGTTITASDVGGTNTTVLYDLPPTT